MTTHYDPTFRLATDRLLIIGTPSGHTDWYEFEVISNGVALGNIGGQDKQTFIDDMLSVFKQSSGTKLTDIQCAIFKGIIDEDAEYLGLVALSGYNTFYFFKDGPKLIQVVLADSEGRMLSHAQFDRTVFEIWQDQLVQERSS